MTIAYIGLGSNIGDRLDNLRQAVSALDSRGISVTKASSVYQTEAVGPPQPEFLNAVCEIETEYSAQDLLARLKSIEAEMGREPSERWGPRVIDLDLLLYGDEVIEEPDLVVPHPEMAKREFVVVPLLEIAPEVDLPDDKRSPSSFRRGASRVVVHSPPESLGL